MAMTPQLLTAGLLASAGLSLMAYGATCSVLRRRRAASAQAEAERSQVETIMALMQDPPGRITGDSEPTMPARPVLPPGRQRIAMPCVVTHETLLGLGRPQPWSPPVPKDAHHALWEDLHRFAPGAKPKRDPHFGLMHHEPPMSMVCPACELEQTPLTAGERGCSYCGVRLKVHGSRVFWWREPQTEVAEWKP